MKGVSRFIRTLRELPQPIICKLRGVAYGVGSNTALAGDFVVAAHDARLCEVFVNIGVIMDGGGTYFLPRLVGLAKAREIALLGGEVDGKTGASIGLFYKSVPDEDLDREVDELAQKLAQKSPKALALIKEGLEGSLDMTLDAVLEWEASHQAIMLQTEEHKEAVRQFLGSKGKRGGG
jgi:2-(1,2-epoxy-1,2-dihydrophenyl)acetyl-CoA isomerase